MKRSRNICINASYLWQENEACRTGVEVAGQKSWDVTITPYSRPLGHDTDYRQLIPLFSPVLETNVRLLLQHPVAAVQVPTPYLLLCRHSNLYNRSYWAASLNRLKINIISYTREHAILTSRELTSCEVAHTHIVMSRCLM